MSHHHHCTTTGKHRYGSSHAAAEAAAALHDQTGADCHTAARCRCCGGWHVNVIYVKAA